MDVLYFKLEDETYLTAVSQWVLVLAGLSDMARPPEKLSLTQNAALMATGAMWTRWCLIIKPRNILLVAPLFLPSPVPVRDFTINVPVLWLIRLSYLINIGWPLSTSSSAASVSLRLCGSSCTTGVLTGR